MEPGSLIELVAPVYGLNDAPYEWNAEHAQGLIDTGFVQSKIHSSVFLFRKHGVVEGMLGVHVDDDLITGFPMFEKNIITSQAKHSCARVTQTKTQTGGANPGPDD